MTREEQYQEMLSKAKQLIENSEIPESLSENIEENCCEFNDGKYTYVYADKLDAKRLSETLKLFTYIKYKWTESVPVGTSKMQGIPDLPADFIWPKEQYFYAQINLKEVDDPTGRLPETGMLYIFGYSGDGEYRGPGSVYYFNVDEDKLISTPYPEDAEEWPDADDYFDDFRDNTLELTFSKRFFLSITLEDGDFINLIDQKLLEELSTILDAQYLPEEVCDSYYTTIFGQPHWLEREDEFEFDCIDDEDYEPEWKPSNDTMIFQTQMGDDVIHFWISSTDLEKLTAGKSGLLDSAYCTFSG